MTDTSNTYGSGSGAPLGGSNLTDLVSTQKGGVQNLSQLMLGIINAFPLATTSSPVMTGVNNLGTTASVVVPPRTARHGIVFHNTATTNVLAYVYATNMTTAPTLAAPGGALEINPGAIVPFPASQYANINIGFSAFVSTGTTGALTIIEFL